MPLQPLLHLDLFVFPEDLFGIEAAGSDYPGGRHFFGKSGFGKSQISDGTPWWHSQELSVQLKPFFPQKIIPSGAGSDHQLWGKFRKFGKLGKFRK